MPVDIVVGGQYGDEGKGQVCVHMIQERFSAGQPYRFALRVGGSNAEHRFRLIDNKAYSARVLPVAAWIDPGCLIMLGAGHIIHKEDFLNEIAELERMFGNQEKRIFIDANAGVITVKNIPDYAFMRGSTNRGVGITAAQKVLRDGSFHRVTDFPEFAPYIVHDLWQTLRFLLADGAHGIIEGNQGVLLSLNHGHYPYCTAKDTTPVALLAEAGISASYLGQIVAVYRTVPMRVPGNSGPTGEREISWPALEDAIGRQINNGAKRQTGTNQLERLFLWSWTDFEKSLFLSGPDRLVLTFCDWYSADLMGVSLKEHMLRMVEISGKPIYFVRFGPDYNDYAYAPPFKGRGVIIND